MIRLVTLHGIGDAYLTCALFKAFKEKYGESTVIVKTAHVAVAELFSVPYQVDDNCVEYAERSLALQKDYENEPTKDRHLYVHPSFVRSGIRVDHLTAKSFVSHADMWRALMHLPMNTPLELPRVPEVLFADGKSREGKVLIIPEARSWPNTQPKFWARLAPTLKLADYKITINNPLLTLAELFAYAAESEWVIGPQCGFMSAITYGRFPCRKTFCTPSWNPPFECGGIFPYAYVTKFGGEDYDVEEFEIQDNNHDQLITCVMTGKNASRFPYSPDPVKSVSIPLSLGDFYDRLTVLLVKADKFQGSRRAYIQRELDRYLRAATANSETNLIGHELVDELLAINHNTFLLCETYVPGSLRGEQDVASHIRAIEYNKRRVELKQQIDKLFHAAYSDVKDYYVS